MCRLRGTLNVVHLEEAFEDDTHVHLVMEYCRGGTYAWCTAFVRCGEQGVCGISGVALVDDGGLRGGAPWP